GPLVDAKVFRSARGGYLSHAELARESVIGVIGDDETLAPAGARTIVHASGPAREELRRMFGSKVVSYHKAVSAKRLDARALAKQLRPDGRTPCIAVRDDKMTVAIALSAEPQLHLYHCGVWLGARTRHIAML